MSFKYFFNLMDIYGYTPRLFIDGYSKNATIFGIILTLITYLFFIIIFIYYLNNLLFNQTLTVISSTRTATLNDSIKMNNENFYFAFALEDKFYNLYIDEQIYYPEIFYKRGVRNSSGQFDYSDTTKFELDTCNLSQFGNNFKELFSSFPLKKMYCIKNLNHILKGGFSDNEYSFITLKIYKCINGTNKNNVCKIQEEIDDKLDGAIFTFQYQNYIFDPKNYSNPFKPILGDFMTTISQKYFKELYVYLKQFSLTTDKGLIFEDKFKKTLYLFDYSNDLMSFQSKEHFFQLTFRMSTNVNEISRSYIKAQILISYIGGFITFINTVFILFNKFFFIKFINYEKIINKVFFYNPDNDNFDKKEKLYSKNIKNKNDSNLNFDSNIKIYNKSFNLISLNKNGKYFISNENILEKSSNQKSLDEDLIKVNNFKEKIANDNNLIYYSNNYKKNKLSHIIQNSNSNISINILYKLTKKYKINLSYFKKLFHLCFTKNRDIYFYKKGIGIIQQKLDIITIIKESFDLELIKKLNLTEEQIFLLNYYIKNNLVKYKYINKFELKNNFLLKEKTIKSLNNLLYYNKEKNFNIINNYLLDIFINQ